MSQMLDPGPAPGVPIDVSGYVRRARRLADLNQRELAAHIGVDQSAIARIEGGRDIDVRTLVHILEFAGLRLAVLDENGHEVMPMPVDVFRDRAGRRRPAHLDVDAVPDRPTYEMLLRRADPIPEGGAWHHLRRQRDELRAAKGRAAGDEQLTESEALARRRARRR